MESAPAINGFCFPACLFIAVYGILWVFRRVHGSSRHNSIITFIALHSLPLDLLIALSQCICALVSFKGHPCCVTDGPVSWESRQKRGPRLQTPQHRARGAEQNSTIQRPAAAGGSGGFGLVLGQDPEKVRTCQLVSTPRKKQPGSRCHHGLSLN